jgi:hypothetical protein
MLNKFLGAILMTSLLALVSFAQDTTGKLVGTISAPDGAIAGANVVVRDNQTGKERTIIASENGTFEVSQLEFGTYTVTITATGYKTFTAKEVKIDAGREYSLDAVLEVGQITEQVTVTAGAEQINSSNAELSTTVSSQQIRELPLNGRNPLSLLNLQAGVNPTTSSINGQRSASTAVTRDGLNVQDNFIRTGTFVSDQPTVDDTGEFTVTTQNAGVEQGGGTALVQLVTPRGGKSFHGSLYEFNRNSAFTANSFFNNANGVPKPFLNRNQYGGSISGPVPFPAFGEGDGPFFVKNKAFFFFNYEAFRLAQQVTATATTLLPQARTGEFTYIDSRGTADPNDDIARTVNVLTGANFASTITSAQGGVLGVDPVIQARLLNLLPTTANGVTTGINYTQTTSFLRSDPRTRHSYTSRFDYDFNDRHSINFVYRRNDDVDARTDIASGFSTVPFVNTTGPTDFFVGAYRWAITNNFSNEVRAGFQDSGVIFDEGNSIPTDYLISQSLVTSPEGSFRTQGRNTLYRNIQDNAVYGWGNHSFRFGGQAEFQEVESLNYAGVTPTYTISSTTNPNTPGLLASQFQGVINSTDLARANALRYLLGGVVGSGSRTANLVSASDGYNFSPSIYKLNYNIYSAYISDQWRLKQNFTLNLGLRYEYYTPLNNPQRRYLEPVFPNPDDISSVAANGGVLDFIGGNAGTPGDFTRPDKNNFAPSVSFAYSPQSGKGFFGRLLGNTTVLRGGFRISYLNDEYLRAPDAFNQANSGLGALNSTATNISAALTPRGIYGAVPDFPVPSFTPPPRTFATNNAQAGFLGSVFGVDPNYQVPKVYEWNFGIQREIGFKTVLEVRYVGSMGNDMIRSIDVNQIDTVNNGFLTDFVRAQGNLAANDTERSRRIAACVAAGGTTTSCTNTLNSPTIVVNGVTVANPNYFPRNGGFTGVAGTVNLPVFNLLAGQGSLTNSTNIQFLEQNRVGSLAQNYIGLRQQGSLVFQPTSDIFALEILTNGGKYRYNSLQAEVRRRFDAGLYFQVNYTFQKTLADIPDDSQVRQSPYQDNNNPGLQYGRPDYDRTHTLNANMIFELPFGKGKKFLDQGGLVNWIFGGFQFASIINISSGAPLGIVDPRSTSAITSRSTRQSATSSLTTDQIKALTGIFDTPNGIYFINPSVLFARAGIRQSNGSFTSVQRIDLTQPLPTGFTLIDVRATSPQGQAPFAEQVFFFNGPGSVGNLPRNFLNGTPFFNWDASLSKSFRFGETKRLQIRAEAFNVLNRPVLNWTADLNIDSSSFGRITSTNANSTPRILQFGARFDF